MQTRTPSFRSVSFIAKRVCALLCTAILMPALTACSMPRIAGRAEAEQRQSPCEKAYFNATADNKIAHDQHQHIIRRYFSAQQAVSAWTNTAAQCPARFAEGTLRSAQARHMARALGDQLSVAVAPITLSRFDDVESLDVDSKSLATAAQAEDRAGFAMEVLAARNSGHATLDISNRHKTTSQRFAPRHDARFRHRPYGTDRRHHRNELRAKRDNGNRRKLQCRERSFPVTRHQCKTVDGFASAIPGRACRSDCGPCRIGA